MIDKKLLDHLLVLHPSTFTMYRYGKNQTMTMHDQGRIDLFHNLLQGRLDLWHNLLQVLLSTLSIVQGMQKKADFKTGPVSTATQS
jgi:hypothetical protein